MKQMSIGQLSKKAGVKVTTIRYYESIGLIAEPERSESGRRLYGEDAVQILSFVRHGRDLGFSMPAIGKLLALQQDSDQNCESVNDIAQEQLAEVQKRLQQLNALEVELKRMILSCKGGTVSECRVIATLNDHDQCLAGHPERLRPL